MTLTHQKINSSMETICLMRDICRAIQTFEADFVKVHHLSLNEAMLLCSLSEGQLSAAGLAEVNVMTPSHTSKVIRSLEEKGLLRRVLGKDDRRKMYFELTDHGRQSLSKMRCGSVGVPEILQPLFRGRCTGME